MLIFGHIGLTIAIIYTFQRIRFPGLDLDYRLVILGSLLPDIIDKPIGYIIFQKYYENGWIYGHSLLFSLVLLILSYSELKALKQTDQRNNRNDPTAMLKEKINLRPF